MPTALRPGGVRHKGATARLTRVRPRAIEVRMKFARLRTAGAWAAVAATVGMAAPNRAYAADAPDDRTVADGLVAQLEHDASHSALMADSLARAREALERGKRFRASADELRARTADGLAREWAETAQDLGIAADAEAHAADVRRKAREAQALLERTRALVEEGIARLGRLRAAIAAADRARADGHTAVEVHDGDPKAARPANAGTHRGAGAPPAGHGQEGTP
jgi:hypothetical protein